MNIQRIGVVGAGQMGQGIAQVAAQSGFQVMVADQNITSAQTGVDKIKTQLEKALQKQKITQEELTKTMSNLNAVNALSDLKDCDLVIEAVSENVDLKKKIWKELDQHSKAEALFASNTASISITELAAATKRPSQRSCYEIGRRYSCYSNV